MLQHELSATFSDESLMDLYEMPSHFSSECGQIFLKSGVTFSQNSVREGAAFAPFASGLLEMHEFLML